MLPHSRSSSVIPAKVHKAEQILIPGFHLGVLVGDIPEAIISLSLNGKQKNN